MLVPTREVEDLAARLFLDDEVVVSAPSKRFTPPSRRNPALAHRIRRPVLDHHDPTGARGREQQEDRAQRRRPQWAVWRRRLGGAGNPSGVRSRPLRWSSTQFGTYRLRSEPSSGWPLRRSGPAPSSRSGPPSPSDEQARASSLDLGSPRSRRSPPSVVSRRSSGPSLPY